jgi:DNA gyrase subunit A
VLVKPGEGCLLISQEGMVIRFAIDEVRKTGRAAQGVRLLNLASDQDRVVALAKIDAAAQALDEEEEAEHTATAETSASANDTGEPPKLNLE